MLETLWQEIAEKNDALTNARNKAWARFSELGLPRKSGPFQYLSLQKLTFPKLAAESHPSLSTLPPQIVCLPLTQAIRSYGLFLQARFAKKENDPFALLNAAFQTEGLFLYVPPKCSIDVPLELTQTVRDFSSPRLQVYLGRGAKLNIVQTTLCEKNSLRNGHLDCVLDEGAELSFYENCQCEESAQCFQSVRVTQQRDSKFKMLTFTKGASLARTSIHVELAGENAETELRGLSRLEGEREAHAHVLVEHIAPHTRSRQHFKTVLKEQSRSSFEGKIYVHPAAQKTEAYQLNNNLVLSDTASANSKPNLEIFADDVKASHGATVAQLDAEELFYMRSRGLSEAQAKQWLVDGFCNELILAAPQSLREKL